MTYEKLMRDSMVAIFISVICLVIGFAAGFASRGSNVSSVESAQASEITPQAGH